MHAGKARIAPKGKPTIPSEYLQTLELQTGGEVILRLEAGGV